MLEYVQTNWVQIAAGIVLVERAVQVIVNLTPSTKDNEIFDKVVAFLARFGIRMQ